jgi:TRAP-type mannitol/chloroaromatic compound transport system substrate-binding protein
MKKLFALMVTAFVLGSTFPAEVAAQAPATHFKWRLQSANPAGTPHMDLLNRLASNIDRMSGGRLKIEVLPAGAIIAPFEILDGVNKGIIEAGQWWTHYATGKHPAGGLFSAPLGGAGSGLDQFNHLSWYLRGGGRELYLEYYQKILKTDVMAFLYGPDGPEAFGWVRRVPKTVSEYTKMRFRMSSGLPSDVLRDMGGVPMNLSGAEVIPAAERGLIDGVEWINPASDLKLGLSDVFKNYSLQGLHQAIDIADIVINGKNWRALPPDLQAIVEVAMTTSIFEALMYFVDENSKALNVLTKEKGVTLFDAPVGYADSFIKSARRVLAKYEAQDAFFKRVLDSQRRFATVVVPYTKETNKLTQLIAGAADSR